MHDDDDDDDDAQTDTQTNQQNYGENIVSAVLVTQMSTTEHYNDDLLCVEKLRAKPLLHIILCII